MPAHTDRRSPAHPAAHPHESLAKRRAVTRRPAPRAPPDPRDSPRPSRRNCAVRKTDGTRSPSGRPEDEAPPEGGEGAGDGGFPPRRAVLAAPEGLSHAPPTKRGKKKPNGWRAPREPRRLPLGSGWRADGAPSLPPKLHRSPFPHPLHQSRLRLGPSPRGGASSAPPPPPPRWGPAAPPHPARFRDALSPPPRARRARMRGESMPNCYTSVASVCSEGTTSVCSDGDIFAIVGHNPLGVRSQDKAAHHCRGCKEL